MKKLIYMGMGLCLLAALFAGCEKKPLDEPAVAEAPAEDVGENYVEKAFGMELQMVYVQGGTFMMGATEEQGEDAEENEKPVHKVTLDDFYIGKFEVTQAQWEAVMGTTLSDIQIEENVVFLFGIGDDYPMYYISLREAQAFCSKMSTQTGKKYRLPTEAEWEYAARGGQKADGTKYVGSHAIDEVAWYDGTVNDSQARPVGQKKPNSLGLYDMSGNVAELCSDWYNSDYYSISPVVNPQGPEFGVDCVGRGGFWGNAAENCRVSVRHNFGLSRAYNAGFRVVCER